MSGGARGGRWEDLAPRVITGVALAVIGVAALWAGGWWFRALVALATGAIFWEMRRMLAPHRPAGAMGAGAIGAAVVALAPLLPGWALAPVFAAVALTAALDARAEDRPRAILYALFILTAGFALAAFRDSHGLVFVAWLVAVVVVTDIAGYFAGRLIGGPKFWPRVSPKKTWAGIVAGWMAAAGIGGLFAALTGQGLSLVLLSAVVSFASQMGDAAESALKRRAGVKDASALLPGHGGVWDRFDALLGAALMALMMDLLGLMPVMGGMG
ncbi:phosphatidate cytidylyltransferase [Meinhardsimonia xiamenensis]|jgi:phosphatidate cytidylyltransferase|uniref:Phosphatidate cytidylyltransferase n=1 Tax=Meinhardsimonia xiamenensis TaxID=990712 RepID=A0A1G9G6I0_9RHOB|nr:phosphatidate cytidylyltransferase [Meinhardsimonia xiamenensis]PRX32671.1 phosphatidate cytidylyltransferase [Meinhardsimonia xiamenensis]SDK95883.1 phosphatidate cytidylyltransferase [Meinhardsimonia xiamenensis]